MSEIAALRVLLFGGEALAASTLLLALAWLGASQKAASRRHLAWCAGLGALLLLPLLGALTPALFHLSIAAPPPLPQEVIASYPAEPPPSGFSLDAPLLAHLMLALWLGGVLVIAARAALAAFALHRLRASSVVHRFGHLPIAGPACELRLSSRDKSCGPVTWGLFRPVILLPKDAPSWPQERLDAVLRHELAHVERRDCLTQMLGLAACALYWPNPLVWFAARRLRREAEIAADDVAIVSGVRPSTYASALLRIANDFRVRPVSHLSHMPLAMAAPSALEARLQSVLAPTQPRTGVTSMDVVRIACFGFVAAAALAFARPSLAEETPQQLVENTTADKVAPAGAMSEDEALPEDDVSQNVAPVAPTAPVPPAALRHAAGAKHVYRVETVTPDGDREVRIIRRHGLSPKERQEIHIAIRKAHDAIAAVKPEIERAVRDAHIEEGIAAAMHDPHMQLMIEKVRKTTGAEVHRALAEARAAIAREHLSAKTSAAVAAALAQAEARLSEEHMRIEDEAIDEDDH